ncbi:FadR/GntR family transcriptional regulator [Actinomadura rupiterrae]|uniref:FadR/GntR family transcriptional regulator n=1 Tax=Actinomadura rupiterrae TaxID=559627 RepID=UPI0020A51974|nr:FadR/GntR family transcriptional regulator [Actinomadura rupiterrae]MCP2335690.1 DNA-binding FadR family transcriptional regulator [Actinomadura rupiterrae]
MTEDATTPRTTVTERAIAQIRAKLGAGELLPGQRLPTERELAVELGLSRSSMREAIRALTALGVLESRHGAGVYVTRLSPDDLLETFGAVAEMSRGRTLLHLVQVRKILEPAAAATAAARIDESGLALLRVQMRAMERGVDSEEIVGHDMEFHRIINEAAGNPVLAAILGGLNTRTFRARVWHGRQEADAFARSFHEHAAIYRALSERDPEAARTAAAVHIGAVEDWARRQADTDPEED